MGESLSGSGFSAIEIGGPTLPQRDRTVPYRRKVKRRKFGAVAKVLWRKPAAEISHIANVNIRTAKRILRGDAEVPGTIVAAAVNEMLREQE
jgi:hypothetical protein